MIVNCRVTPIRSNQIAMNWPIVLVLLACFSVQLPRVHSIGKFALLLQTPIRLTAMIYR